MDKKDNFYYGRCGKCKHEYVNIDEEPCYSCKHFTFWGTAENDGWEEEDVNKN